VTNGLGYTTTMMGKFARPMAQMMPHTPYMYYRPGSMPGHPFAYGLGPHAPMPLQEMLPMEDQQADAPDQSSNDDKLVKVEEVEEKEKSEAPIRRAKRKFPIEEAKEEDVDDGEEDVGPPLKRLHMDPDLHAMVKKMNAAAQQELRLKQTEVAEMEPPERQEVDEEEEPQPGQEGEMVREEEEQEEEEDMQGSMVYVPVPVPMPMQFSFPGMPMGMGMSYPMPMGLMPGMPGMPAMPGMVPATPPSTASGRARTPMGPGYGIPSATSYGMMGMAYSQPYGGVPMMMAPSMPATAPPPPAHRSKQALKPSAPASVPGIAASPSSTAPPPSAPASSQRRLQGTAPPSRIPGYSPPQQQAYALYYQQLAAMQQARAMMMMMPPATAPIQQQHPYEHEHKHEHPDNDHQEAEHEAAPPASPSQDSE